MDKSKTVTASEADTAPSQPPRRRWWSRRSRKSKAVIIALGSLLLIAITTMSVPASRYAVAGLFIKRDVVVAVYDARTNRPVTDAIVATRGVEVKTAKNGTATVRAIAPGPVAVTISKANYKTVTAMGHARILGATGVIRTPIVATGLPVTLVVTNKVTGQPLEGVKVGVGDTTSTTDTSGRADLIVSAKQPQQRATVKLAGFNDGVVTVDAGKADSAAASLVPSGQIYYLSKRTGRINVMKSNLDGSEARIVVAGTGREADADTVLLATTDWRYLAFKAKRDSSPAKLYLIDTASDRLEIMDEGDAQFNMIGWTGTTFVYTVARTKGDAWVAGATKLKSFTVGKTSPVTLDQTDARGSSNFDYGSESIVDATLVGASVVYAKTWYGNQKPNPPRAYVVKAGGGSLQMLHEFSGADYVGLKLYRPGEIFFKSQPPYDSGAKNSYFEYDNGAFTATDEANDDVFAGFYPTYVASPDNKQTFYYEPRDGKNTLFLADGNGEGAKDVLDLSEYTPFGWYGSYVLISKGGSELFIATPQTLARPYKITDYHRATGDFRGYGSGYGAY